jgi:mevalonate kinase
MAILQPRGFPAKVLIAGEYSVLTGGEAFACPLNSYEAYWATTSEVDPRLESLIPFIHELDFLDSDLFEREVFSGYYIKSEIPMGKGIGSSGAVAAAFYHRYSFTQAESIHEIRAKLALIESAFHGKSSGMDPLISYSRRPILKKGDTFQIIENDLAANTEFQKIYLLDSTIARNSISPIEWYFGELKNSAFFEFSHQLEIANQALIQNLLSGNSIRPYFHTISALQWDFMRPLIVPTLQAFWQKGLRSQEYFLKICGKGTGGYYLLYSDPIDHPLSWPIQALL